MDKTERSGSPEGRHQLSDVVDKPQPVVTTQAPTRPAPDGKRPSFEFRGFDFFAKRDFNELKSASDAYFAPTAAKAKRFSRAALGAGPASWLRDPTPPSSPVPRDDRTTAAAAAEGRFPIPPDGNNPRVAPEEDRGRGTCGLKKSRFRLLVGLLILLILVVIGVGVGVGVGVSKRSAAAVKAAAASAATDHPASSSSPGVPTGSSDPSATPTKSTTPTASSTGPANTAGKLDCPAANGTTYQVPGSDKKFLRICGIDYSGAAEAVELTYVPTQTMLDCMTNCAGTYGCVGAGWGFLDGDTGYEHQCWMKKKLMKSHEASVDWSFAVLL